MKLNQKASLENSINLLITSFDEQLVRTQGDWVLCFVWKTTCTQHAKYMVNVSVAKIM